MSTRPRRRPSSKFGTVNYSVEEMRRLNAKVRAVLPVAGDDWLRVAYQFNYLRPEGVPYREVESLKRKFKKMYCARGKALPDYLLEAKELRGLITQRSDIAADTGSETQEEQQGEQTTELASRLRRMEDEYHRTVEGQRPEDMEKQKEATADTPLAQICAGARVTTSGIIEMLRQSVDRNRRSAEEAVLCENARVRRERKKRKMEQTLISIHQEQRERELAGDASGAATEAEADASTSANLSPVAAADPSQQEVASPSQQQPRSPSLTASALNAIGALAQPPSIQDAQSLGVMESLLQFMTAQQFENAQRLESEQARREQERRERDKRRHQKELQRRQDHHELMLAMGTLLGDRFPASLRHYLNDADQQSIEAPSLPRTTPSTLINDAAVSTQVKSTANEPQGGESYSHLPAKTPATDQSDARASVDVENDSVQSHVQQADNEATSAIL